MDNRPVLIPLHDRRFVSSDPSHIPFLETPNERLQRFKSEDKQIHLSQSMTIAEEREATYAYLRGLEDLLLVRLSEELEILTESDLDERGWKILLGHWLRRLLESAYLRFTLFSGLNLVAVPGVAAPAQLNFRVPINQEEWLFQHFSFWGEFLFNYQCLKHLINLQHSTEVEEVLLKVLISGEMSEASPPKTKSASWKVLSRLDGALNCFSKSDDSVYCATYLPWKVSLGLQLTDQQVPRIHRAQFSSLSDMEGCSIDTSVRETIVRRISDGLEDSFAKFVCRLISTQLPQCYLEGFAELEARVKNLKLPRSPKVIFTSNLFETSEEFKLYVAMKTKAGSTYVVGQHGNSYGVRIGQSPTIEERTSDRFLTWGWQDASDRYVPIGNLKNSGRRKVRGYQLGSLLWVLQGPTAHLEPFLSAELDLLVQSSSTKLRECLSAEIISHLRLRRHPLEKTFAIEADYRLPGKDSRCADFVRDVRKSRLVLFNYDSTGFLELIDEEVPCILLAADGFPHVSGRWTDLYGRMGDEGLLFRSPEECARNIQQIWNDPWEWWESKSVRAVRSEVRHSLARTIQKPVKEISRALRE